MAGVKRRWGRSSESVAKRTRRMPKRRTVRNEARFFESYMTATIIPGAGGALSQIWQQWQPTLGGIPSGNLTQITGLFDLYKINRVTLQYLPRFTAFDAGASTANPVPLLTINPDPNEAFNASGSYGLASYQAFLGNCETVPRTVTADKPIKISYKPKMRNVTTGEVKPFPWTTVTNTSTPAFGCDVYIHAVNFAAFPATTEFDVLVTLDISCRGKR